MKKALFNWSGGKDSALALYKCLQQNEYSIDSLFTSINHETKRISMHGVRYELLQKQAELLNIPLKTMSLPIDTSMATYEKYMLKQMSEYKSKGVNYSIFGDIFLEDLRVFRENQLDKVKIKAVFPLWKQNTKDIINEFIDAGFKTIVTAVDASKLGKEFVGRVIDKQFLKDLPKDVDPCGENGEFHTFVFDGPIFKNPIDIEKGEIIYKEYQAGTCSDFEDNDNKDTEIKNFGFWFCDIIEKQKPTL